MIQDNIKATGELTIIVIDDSGQQVDKREVKNLVVTTGRNHIASRLASNTSIIMSHMSVGDSNTSPVLNDTGLGNELGRVALDSTSVTDATVTYVATFPPGTGTGTLTEAGIFNDASAGDMLCRTNFNDVNKSVSDTIIITWNVTVS